MSALLIRAAGNDSLAAVQATSPCPVCARTRAFLVGTRDRYGQALTTIACAECGLFRTEPLPTSEELRSFYEREYRSGYKRRRTPSLRHVYRAGKLAIGRLKALAPMIPVGSRILDVGCASGEWLYVLNNAGRAACGLEIDPVYASFGRKQYGVDIANSSLLDFASSSDSFEVITMFHVLEHLPEPVIALRRCHDWLRPGGILIVEVPNIGSSHQNPNQRFHYAHVFGFTLDSLYRTSQRGGFVPLESRVDVFQRNILACFIKGTESKPTSGLTRSPHVTAIVSSMRSRAALIRYLVNPSTYIRTGQRAWQFLGEYLATRRGTKPHASCSIEC